MTQVDIHIENSLPVIQLQWVGKIPINSIHGLCRTRRFKVGCIHARTTKNYHNAFL